VRNPSATSRRRATRSGLRSASRLPLSAARAQTTPRLGSLSRASADRRARAPRCPRAVYRSEGRQVRRAVVSTSAEGYSRASRYVRGRKALAFPHLYKLDVGPEVWFLEDEGYELAVFRSDPETAPRPSRTGVENARDELAAWTISDGQVQPLELTPLTE
jgi:hypothetical protein